MSKKRLDKKIPRLEPFFDSILVCNNKKLRPYIEIFVNEPENIAQQNLGILLGVFEIEDTSEDSSYIANYLISVIKREYFSKPKRAPIESFEAALHKGNLALSKLAEHENIQWIGKLNALVAVIEKNNLHLSQTGTSCALLLRSKGLTNISEGLSESEVEPHPLKTFINVSSGRLEAQDKIIIATGNIFNIFSFEEIKKSALRFNSEKFVQFLRTALGNELEKAAILISEIREKKEIAPVTQNKKTGELNAFSQEAFRGAMAKKTAQQEPRPDENISEEKTGHLYIKEGDTPDMKASPLGELWIATKENFEIAAKKTVRFSSTAFEKISAIKIPRISVPAISLPKIKKDSATEKEKPENLPLTGSEKEKMPVFSEARKKRIAGFFANLKELSGRMFRQLLPDFSKIKRIALRLDYQQRIYALLVLSAIIFIPLIALRAQKYIQSKNAKIEEPKQEIIIPLSQDKNVMRIDNSIVDKFDAAPAHGMINLNGKIFAITKSGIVSIEDRSNYPIPADFGDIRLYTSMDDLNLIFLMNQSGKIISFSPTAKKFQDNNISIPENSNIVAAGTYLTYLYFVDSKNNQIYRYPRAEGGFGAGSSWLKDTIDLSQATGMALSDNIFIADGKSLLKFFKGKKQDFQIENAATPIAPFKVYTKPDSQNIFVLDKQNSRIIKLDLNGSIVTQYYNSEIANAIDLAIDEANNKIYFTSAESVFSFASN